MPALNRASTANRGYGHPHQLLRAQIAPLVLAGGARCSRCGEAILPGEPWHLDHRDDGLGYNGPAHRRCNIAANEGGTRRAVPVTLVEERLPEHEGLPVSDRRWRVPWLEPFLDIPAEATWPRLMTVPHPRAVASLGEAFVRDAEAREGQPLRWWQRLVAARLLEIDGDGRLVWDAMVLTVARQVGKSWLLRELCLWRMQQSCWFGEPQDVVHTGKDLAVCREVQRPARAWARLRDGWKVREVNGQEEILLLGENSRWLLRAKESAYSLSVSMGAVDEAWKVKAASVDESLTPTMVERNQPQLLLISTAHRRSEDLMLQRRQAALDELETGQGDLLVEWSASRDAALDDVEAWRAASPHWTLQRQRLIGRQLASARAGVLRDPEEPDPEESFRAQWLNQWPQDLAPVGGAEPLLPGGLWARLEERLSERAPWFVAVEDGFGKSAAVAACCVLDDGRFQVDGWRCDSWDAALFDVRRLALTHEIEDLQVGASMLNRVPADMNARSAGAAETRPALVLLRDLAAGGMIVHDDTAELDQAVNAARVKENPTGLALVTSEDTHLVKAMVWALAAAHKPAPVAAVY
jgi:hypothetical protein